MKQKGRIIIYLSFALIVIGIIVTVYILRQKTPSTTSRVPAATSRQSINSDSELMRISDQLDRTNLEQIETGLKENQEDLATF